jgi:hypothetical protein
LVFGFFGCSPSSWFLCHLLLFMLCWASQHHDWVFLLLPVLWQIQYVVNVWLSPTAWEQMKSVRFMVVGQHIAVEGHLACVWLLLKLLFFSVFSPFSRVGSIFISFSCSLICCLDLKCL